MALRAQQYHHQDYIKFPCGTMSVANVYTVSSRKDFCTILPNHSLLLQLTGLFLSENLLQGTLPDSWSEFSSVSLYLDAVCCHIAVLQSRCKAEMHVYDAVSA